LERLVETVEHYLRLETTYALMVTGEWGTGKTYYYKNNLSSKISSIEVYNNAEKKYVPVYISLFGVNSVENLQLEIFFQLYPFLNIKKLRLAGTLGKIVTKGFLLYNGLGNLSGIVDQLNPKNAAKIKPVDYETIVLCLDDFERMSSEILIEEVIGFINKLVDADNIKVIILANEGEGILKNNEYKRVKEKIIGDTIEFIPDIPVIYDNLIKQKFASFSAYQNFLNEHKVFVLDIFLKDCSNLRTLIFSLNYFHRIFSEIEKNLFASNGLNSIKSEILLSLLKFTLIITKEYKKGSITYKYREDLDSINNGYPEIFNIALESPSMHQLPGEQKVQEDKVLSKREEILDIYYNGETFQFYESVYDYITGGKLLDYSKLQKELSRIYLLEDKMIPPHSEIFNSLKYPKCFNLSDKEYLAKTKKMLQYAFNGKYSFLEYPSIFHFATRFENPLQYKLDHLEKRLKTSIQKKKGNFDPYERDLDFQLTMPVKGEYPDHQERIKSFIINFNKKLTEEQKEKNIQEMELLCYSDFNAFGQKIIHEENGLKYYPIFSDFSSKKFYSFFTKAQSEIQWKIVQFFRIRYLQNKVYNYSEDFVSELAFFENLFDKVDKKSKVKKGKNVSGFIYEEFKKVIKEINKCITSLELKGSYSN
jgi:hypothetical protein